jgi:hypothetical protein
MRGHHPACRCLLPSRLLPGANAHFGFSGNFARSRSRGAAAADFIGGLTAGMTPRERLDPGPIPRQDHG